MHLIDKSNAQDVVEQYFLSSLRYIIRGVFDRYDTLKTIFVERGEEEKIRRELSQDMKRKVIDV